MKKLDHAAAIAALAQLRLLRREHGATTAELRRRRDPGAEVRDNIYMLVGDGGNITMQVGDDGIFLVDTQFAPLSEKIVAAIRRSRDKPIHYIVNTHHHGDHTGGNANLRARRHTVSGGNMAGAIRDSGVGRRSSRTRTCCCA